MSFLFSNKVIVILSPQPWDHIHISKHHYANTLGKNNTVYFIGPPAQSYWFSHSVKHVKQGLFVMDYSVPGPSWLRFKFVWLYKFLIKSFLPKVLQKNLGPVDYCFDFGCYRQFDSLEFIPATTRIFFPVDDFPYIKGELRGSDFIFTVSKNIQLKYPAGVCKYVNHGLSDEFSIVAQRALAADLRWLPDRRIRVCYAGNLFLRFIDREVFKKLISENAGIEFHFFGNADFNTKDRNHVDWDNFLRNSSNVFLHGPVSTVELVEKYKEMDVFLLCYKPDNIEYHGENSHKILEYLSTGKTVVSSHIYVYKESDLIVMPPDFSNEKIIELFSSVIKDLPLYNCREKMNARRYFALQHTYDENIRRIAEFIEPVNEKVNSVM